MIKDFTDSFDYITDAFKDNTEMLKLNAKAYFHFASGRHFDFTALPDFIMFYVINGSINLACNEHLYNIEKHGIALITPETAFKFHSASPETSGFLFIISGKMLNFYFNKLNFKYIYMQKPSPASDIGSLSEKLYKHSEQDDELAMIFYSNKLNDIFYELCRLHISDDEHSTGSHIPSYIKAIKKSFDTEYYKDYSLDELEEIYNKNKYRISREFSAAYDISPFRYLNKVRINEAKKLLLNSDLNIRETGYEVGIKNTNHFINLFKRETGTTPLLFRKDAPDFLKND